MSNGPLSPEEIALARKLLVRMGDQVAAPPPRPGTMTAEAYDAHVAESLAITKRNNEHDVNPRAYVFDLADRIAALEAQAGSKPKAKAKA